MYQNMRSEEWHQKCFCQAARTLQVGSNNTVCTRKIKVSFLQYGFSININKHVTLRIVSRKYLTQQECVCWMWLFVSKGKPANPQLLYEAQGGEHFSNNTEEVEC